MPRKRGGQRKHWAEKARVWAWYCEIKRRCDWSDYKLDNEFAWTEEGRAYFSSVDRPRIFELIRKKAQKPAGLDERWRGMSALVSAVEQHPIFKGTQALYEAQIWSLLQEQTISPELLRSRIDRLLRTNGLARIPYEKLSATHGELIARFGRVTLFDRCLLLSLNKMERLSQIELTWSLYQQNEPAHNWGFRAALESIVDDLLDHFFLDYLPEHHLNFYPDAIEWLLQSRLNAPNCGYIEVEGAWPILPQHLAGKLEEKHLTMGLTRLL